MERNITSPENYEVYQGKTFTVEFYYTSDGKMPAWTRGAFPPFQYRLPAKRIFVCRL